MIDIFNSIEQKFTDYVIVGSYALYLQNLIPSFSGKDIDIVVNVSQDHLDNESDVKKLSSTRFTDYGWVFKVGDMWVEVFNKTLPSYDIINVRGKDVKVKTVEACREFYSSIDLNSLNTYPEFITKLESYRQL